MASSSNARTWTIGVLVALISALSATPAHAKVFYSRSEALALAFPDADRIDDQSILLGDEQAARIEQLAKSRLESRLVRVHRAYRGKELLGYAVIDVHTVRTLPEAFLVVLSPEGAVRMVRVLAFHEPLEYMPSARWYRQFEQKTIGDPLRVDRDVHGIVGATLSARATTEGVRRVLALYQVVVSRPPE
ncbi:MAG: FMN-binding protein [Myxococcota bacterium]